MIRLANLIVVCDLLVVDPHVGLQRRSGAFGCIDAECLNMLPAQEIRGGYQLRKRDPALPAAPLNGQLDHGTPHSKRSEARRANTNVTGGVIAQVTGMCGLVNITIVAEIF